jgi:hypothetical protein|tara:strand:- start:70 stop:624 length:555 start_codon:yes stop_codon:yes gene_type:complete
MKKIYESYFQKSKVFLYPLLNIPKGVRFVPSQTYLTWEDQFDLSRYKLIALYKINPDCKDFEPFHKETLKANPLYEYYEKIDKESHIYVFSIANYKNDINKFIKGQYSKMTKKTKKIITKFFGKSGTISEYIESYLYPEKYFEIYSDILNVPVEDLENVGELCDKPDLERETFKNILVALSLFK